MNPTDRLRIGELAARCGVNARTVDYYTRLGLLEPATRTDGNFRLYEVDAVDRLSQIKQMQQQRLSLQEIREWLACDDAASELLALEEIRHDLETINRRLAAVEATVQTGRASASVSVAASSALAYALAAATYLQELASYGGITPP